MWKKILGNPAEFTRLIQNTGKNQTEQEKLGYKIIIITARPFSIISRHFTVMQLRKYGILYDELYLTPAINKGNLKKQTGYNYILSVGDQDTDLTHSMYGVKINVL